MAILCIFNRGCRERLSFVPRSRRPALASEFKQHPYQQWILPGSLGFTFVSRHSVATGPDPPDHNKITCIVSPLRLSSALAIGIDGELLRISQRKFSISQILCRGELKFISLATRRFVGGRCYTARYGAKGTDSNLLRVKIRQGSAARFYTLKIVLVARI